VQAPVGLDIMVEPQGLDGYTTPANAGPIKVEAGKETLNVANPIRYLRDAIASGSVSTDSGPLTADVVIRFNGTDAQGRTYTGSATVPKGPGGGYSLKIPVGGSVTISAPDELEGLVLADRRPYVLTDLQPAERRPFKDFKFLRAGKLAGLVTDNGTPPSPLAGQQVFATALEEGRYQQAIMKDGPVAYYRLDEAQGSAVSDSSGKGNHATLVGGVTRGVAGGILNSGNAAMAFDGTTGFIQLPTAPFGAYPSAYST
jgi:hypothetical protein